MNVNMGYELRGFYTLQVVGEDGIVSKEITFENLITNTGLDFVGAPPTFLTSGGSGQGIAGFCYLGTGTTAPGNTDTKLTTYGTANSGNGTTSYTTTYVAGPPTLWQYVFTYTFSAGIATGTWSEIGVGAITPPSQIVTNEPTVPYLFSHALIVDGGGSPTTISILSSEQLIVTYTLQLFFTTTDISYTPFLINTTSTSGTLRPSLISSPNGTFPSLGAGGLNGANLYTGSLGTITGVPTGTTFSQTTQSTGSYVSGTYTIPINFTWTGAGAIGTWTAITAGSVMGKYQFSVSPSVVIGSGATFSLTINMSWTRH